MGVRTVEDRTTAAEHGITPAPELAGLRVLLVHEWIYTWAGGERCLEQLVALMPHADVLVGIVTPGMRGRNEIARRATESWVGAIPGARTRHRWYLPLHALAFSQFDTSAYDLVVSVSHAFEKAIRARKPGAVHVSYCLTPPRYLWDLDEAHGRMATPLQRIALNLARSPLRAMDRRLADGVDRFVTLSHFVADRVRRSYGRESAVVYPPVSLKPSNGAGDAKREKFLLTLGRLVPYKRVDLAIGAARQLGLRLVVVGDGPERRRLERIGDANVEFLGEVGEEEAGDLLSRCAAFVFCAEEDFGIAPVEANAHGAPVVAFGKGGATETIRDGVTGVFFHEQAAPALADAIERCLERSWDADALRGNARRFLPETFRAGMRAELGKALNGARL